MAVRFLTIYLTLVLLPGLAPVFGQDPLFPFQLPWDDASPGFTDLSDMNVKPAGVLGRLRVGEDGHLYSGDRRERLLGVNISYLAAAPPHASAEKIAARMAKFGLNVVRFHHIDADWGSRVVLARGTGTRELDPANLDRIDYFVSELKKNGLYTNINLLTARDFRAADGVNAAISGMPWKDKQIPAIFDPVLISLQKEFATRFLDRVNPYTGLKYTEDPAIAFVEVINEAGLLHSWRDGGIDRLPAYFSEQLRQRWNSHLRTVYADQTQLADAWALSSPEGTEMLRNRDFSQGSQYWNFEQHADAQGQFTVLPAGGPSGKPAGQVRVTRTGSANWYIQLNQGGLPVEADTVYTLSFQAKADRSKNVTVGMGQAHDPWQGLGFSRSLALTPSWQTFRFSFTLSAGDFNARVNFSDMADQTATYWFADFSLKQGGTVGLFPEENLDAGTVRLILRNEEGSRRMQARADFAGFLWATEEAYYAEMRHHLRETLGVQALLIGTIVGTSTPNLMDGFDVVDSHSYWQHPAFAGETYNSAWWLNNRSVLGERDGGTFSGLAARRIHGKPFSVTEYNHGWPLTTSGEGFLMLAAYGALQDWDALYGYTYSDGNVNFAEDRIAGFFEIQHEPAKMIGLAQAARIFRRGDLSAATHLVAARMDRATEIGLLPTVGAWRLVDSAHVGLPPEAALLHRIALETERAGVANGALRPDELTLPEDGIFESDTGEIRWDTARRVLELRSRRTKGVIGYGAGAEFDLGGISLQGLSSLQGWSAIVLTEAPSSPQATEVRSFLVSAFGLVQNRGTQWRHYPSNAAAGFPPPDGVNLTLSNQGTSPVEAEGVRCDLVLPQPPDRVRAWALDLRGARKAELPVDSSDEGAVVRLGPQYQTLWYELEIRPFVSRFATPPVGVRSGEFLGLALSNPSPQEVNARVSLLGPEWPASAPADRTLAPGGQTAELAPEIVGPPSSWPATGWFEILSNETDLGGFVQFGDFGLRSLDGFGFQPPGPGPWHLTRVHHGPSHFQGAAAESWIGVANPGDSPVDVLLRLFRSGEARDDGAAASVAAGEKEIRLEPRGLYWAPIGQAFETLIADGRLEAQVLGEGEIVVGGVVRLPAARTLFALNAATDPGRGRLWSPQFAALPGLLFTRVKLVNVAATDRRVMLRPVSEDGTPLAPELSLMLGPGEVWSGSAGELIQGEGIGSLEVEIDGGSGVIGDVVFGLENLDYGAAALLDGNPVRRALFGHVASLPGLFFTGLALLNPGDQEAEVRISVRDREGVEQGAVELKLGAGCRISRVLTDPDWLPQLGAQAGGYLLVESSEPIVSQELFGTTSLTLLSAVPPTILE